MLGKEVFLLVKLMFIREEDWTRCKYSLKWPEVF